MKSQILRGEGIIGMNLTLNVCDMFAASQVANTLSKIIENHNDIKSYDKCPYDKRSEAFPEGKPQRIELDDDTMLMLHTLMCKLSYEATSTLFAEEDEEPTNPIGTRENPQMYALPG